MSLTVRGNVRVAAAALEGGERPAITRYRASELRR
jgi:hypothetical protein